ncbi:hypothetical protein [Streptomyces enissocaesilis]|uniref:Uncharacterized protein n=1 Tax=Streptomyces enissocaesilis TaxID=332589 RepID=A0ABN3WYP6_9ACTN
MSARDELVEIVTGDPESSGGDAVWAADLVDAHAAEVRAEQAAEIDRLRAELTTRPQEEYPGELAHLRDLLRAVGRLADTQPKGNPLTVLLIDHYSDSRMVDAQLAKEGHDLGPADGQQKMRLLAKLRAGLTPISNDTPVAPNGGGRS